MLYLDSSAIVKLIIDEPESDALRASLGPDVASSALARTEVMRAALRADADLGPDVEAAMGKLNLIAVDTGILRAASLILPMSIRTLDAIHLATANEFGNELEALITYDGRMAVAAAEAGIDVFAPTAS